MLILKFIGVFPNKAGLFVFLPIKLGYEQCDYSG